MVIILSVCERENREKIYHVKLDSSHSREFEVAEFCYGKKILRPQAEKWLRIITMAEKNHRLFC